MKISENTDTFVIDTFEGPLDLLWHLISRQEIDIYQIPLQKITQQYLDKCKELLAIDIDNGAEFIAMAASLVWLKSKTLLPAHEQPTDPINEEEADPRFEIIHQLIDYCRFKQAAKELSSLEQQQSAYYFRGIDNDFEAKKNLGIAHLTLEDLAGLFREILAKASPKNGIIHEEIWRVSDKIKMIRYLLNQNKKIPFYDIFSLGKSREELIVCFLALLELMKLGEVRVVLEPTQNTVCILATL